MNVEDSEAHARSSGSLFLPSVDPDAAGPWPLICSFETAWAPWHRGPCASANISDQDDPGDSTDLRYLYN